MSEGLPEQPGPRRQTEIYMEGMAGVTPDLPTSYEDLEAAALAVLDEEVAGYVAGGAGGEETMDNNREAFRRWRIVPRMLRDVHRRDLSVTLFGRTYRAPVILAPIGVLGVVHPRAEVAVAEAAREWDLPMALSSVSSVHLGQVARQLDPAPGWFQLYWPSDRAIAASLVARAERAGYEAIVVTVDTPLLAWRERDLDEAYLPFLDGEGLANYLSDPAFCARLADPPNTAHLAAIEEFVDVFGNPALSWDDLAWLREQTDLPIVVKGLSHPEDAHAAVEHGADAVVVSNHGGRQVDGAIAALDCLPDVAAAVGEEAHVLYDSGVRRGADVLRALALGAEAVLLGRPYVYGLALAGADGVREVLANLLADLDLTLGLAGRRAVTDVDRDVVREAGEGPGSLP
jgi:lactate 2-monooxygenase